MMPLLTEDERQAVLLALAKLAVERPGWEHYLAQIAAKLNGPQLFEFFLQMNQEASQ